MSLSTVSKPEDKRTKLKKLREFHQATLNEIGEPEARFIPKMAYRPYGKTELHIAFFESEINKGDDVFVEFTSKELEPEDPKRTLYKWKFNPHYAEEYEQTEPNENTGHVRFLVPVEELKVIKEYTDSENQASFNFDDLPDPETDLPIEQITIRDLAAILLKKPVSNKKWLNEIINSK
jgi:hypothetical protein